MSGLRIAAFRLLCPDPELTGAFYEAAFGARVDPAGVTLGRQRIELVRTAARPARPAASNTTGFQHFAIVVSDMTAAFEQLRSVPAWKAISRAGPERLPESSGGVTAFKFRDPDGHPLEFLQFAPGAVPAAWQGISGLFFGIDHTAITVADTERSTSFYGALGFTVSNRGVNRGIEQARMDDVDAPVVEVTGLTPPGGTPPHLELLSYREPGVAQDARQADDPLATRIVFEGPTTLDRGEHRDPDGHRFVIA